MKKFLIIPGFAKAGTTYLYNQLISEEKIFNVPFLKEFGAFRASTDLQRYLRNYRSMDEDKIFIDASPDYAEPWYDAFNNAKRCLAQNKVMICFCLRSPVERAFSHYLHDLSTNFSRFAYAGSRFEDPRTLARYLFKMAPQIRKAQQVFGKENVVGIELDQMQTHFPQSIINFLGLPIDWKPNRNADKFSAGWIPSIHYGGHNGVVTSISGQLYRIPANTLVICNGPHSGYVENIDEFTARRLLEAAGQWSFFVDKHQIRNAVQKSEEDYKEACSLLNITPSLNPNQFIHVSRHPEMPQDIKAKLEKINVLSVYPMLHASKKITKIAITGNLIFDQTLIERAYSKIESASASELLISVNQMLELIFLFGESHGWSSEKVQYALGLSISIGNKEYILKLLNSAARSFTDIKEVESKLAYYQTLFSDEEIIEIKSALPLSHDRIDS